MTRRYPFAACEVLCCEVDAIFSALLDDAALLARLFSFLDAAGPLDCVRAGFFARAVTCLLVRRHADVMRYLQTTPAWLDRLVAHVDTTSIAEVPRVGPSSACRVRCHLSTHAAVAHMDTTSVAGVTPRQVLAVPNVTCLLMRRYADANFPVHAAGMFNLACVRTALLPARRH